MSTQPTGELAVAVEAGIESVRRAKRLILTLQAENRLLHERIRGLEMVLSLANVPDVPALLRRQAD